MSTQADRSNALMRVFSRIPDEHTESIIHEGVEYAPFVTLYRRTDATSGVYTGRKPDHFVALYVDPDCPYDGLSGVASELYIALAHLEDAQTHAALALITGRNGTQESNGAGKDPSIGEAGTGQDEVPHVHA